MSSEPMICDLTVHGVDADVTRGSIRDVTKLVKSQEKTREYAKALEKTNRELKEAQSQVVQSAKMAALGDLVAGVAHEINTPLGSIHSNADLSQRAVEIVEQSLNDEEFSAIKTKYPRLEKALKALREATVTSLTASDRIVEIVKSLRNFARLDESDRKVADLHEGIESTLTLLRHKLKIGIKVEKNYGDLPELDCFPNRLNQVFMNILVNAIHSMDGKGVITITTRREGENVTLEFCDTGGGIPPSNIGRIFDPGFTTKGAGVGSGLGLSISYRIIQEHDGNIKVKSEPGEGTTFTITLPIRN
ncbi:MAG: hypothetical protein IIB00_07855 [candidate division Zixibacteria bacterium]|nr:hypothetical protein [candidate division Zixibacteria bacterium]